MAYNDQYAGHQEYNPYSNSQPHASYEEPHAAAYDNYGPGYQDTSYPATGTWSNPLCRSIHIRLTTFLTLVLYQGLTRPETQMN